MKIVQLESPFRGKHYEHTEFNKMYANACIRECLYRDESPMASHILYTNATDDTNAEERALGITAGLNFLNVADYSVIYIDLGISEGMKQGIKKAEELGKMVLYRSLSNFENFLEKNKDLLNGYSHIVGEEREITLKDRMLNDIQNKLVNFNIYNGNLIGNYASFQLSNLTDNLEIVQYNLDLGDLELEFQSDAHRHLSRINSDIFQSAIPFEELFYKYRFNKFLNEKLPTKKIKTKGLVKI